jgi:TonB family protein
VGKLKTEALPFDIMRSCCLFLLIVSTLIAAPSFAQKLPADLQKQVDKGFLTREEGELLRTAKRQPSALTPKKSGTKAPPRTLCKQEAEQDSYERDGVDFPYMARLRRDVKRHWTPPDIATTRPLVITFDVERSGDVDKMQVICSSGNNAYDQAAVDAIQHSVPFLPLPDAYKRAIYVILFFRENDFGVILPLGH